MELASRWFIVPILKRLASKQSHSNKREISAGDHDLIILGDSYAQMGNLGWVRQLEASGWKILNLGEGGSCPSQYMENFRAIKSLKPDQIVMILLYIGNDFKDQAIWDESPTEEAYSRNRNLSYFQTDGVYWPFCEPASELWKRSRLLQLISLLRTAVQLQISPNPESVYDQYVDILSDTSLARQDQLLTKMLLKNLHMQQYVFRANGRIFFLQHHNATAYEASEENRRAADHILKMMKDLATYRNVWIIPILSREEIGIPIHRQPLLRNAEFINRLKQNDLIVFDVNQEFEKANLQRNLYLPDAHWNAEGHKVFSAALEQILSQKGKKPHQTPAQAPMLQ